MKEIWKNRLSSNEQNKTITQRKSKIRKAIELSNMDETLEGNESDIFKDDILETIQINKSNNFKDESHRILADLSSPNVKSFSRHTYEEEYFDIYFRSKEIRIKTTNLLKSGSSNKNSKQNYNIETDYNPLFTLNQ